MKGKDIKKYIDFKKDTIWKVGTFVFAALFLVGIFTGGFSFIKGNDVNPTPDNSLVDDDAVLGDKDAPVTMVEFSDYQCPFCGRYFTETYGQIKSQYVDTGKVKIVFRDFPLSFHENAQKAAEAAECAGEQDKYYEMHDKLFQNQQALDVSSLKRYAQEVGLDVAKFSQCLDSEEMAPEVRKDFADGQTAGVRGTPAFFINGKLISGAQPFNVFQQAIEAEL